MNPSIPYREFAHIIENKSHRYALVQSNIGSMDLTTCLVYDLTEKLVLVIEDDEIAYEVLRRLQDSGAPMLQGLPK